MLTDKERRVFELQAIKSRRHAIVAYPKACNKLRKTLTLLKTGRAVLSRCRKDSPRIVKINKRLRNLHIQAVKTYKAMAKYRSDIVIARLILEPRLAWKTDANGNLSHILMPSDFVTRNRETL